MRLDERLKAVVSEIRGNNLLDIGCDHGKVLVTALLEGRVKCATGVDISAQSLDKARVLAKECGVDCDFLEKDGKEVSFENIDILVIAGMGGEEIVRILENRVSYPKTLVLVPHQDKNVLRKFLNDSNLFCKKDYVVACAGKFYDIIVVDTKATGEPFTKDELFTGKNKPQKEAFQKRILSRGTALKSIIETGVLVSETLKSEWEAYSKWLIS